MKVDLWKLPKHERNTLKRRIKWFQERIAHDKSTIQTLQNQIEGLEYRIDKDVKELEKLQENFPVDIKS